MNTAEDINKTIVLGEEKVTASAQEEDPEQSEKAGEEQASQSSDDASSTPSSSTSAAADAYQGESGNEIDGEEDEKEDGNSSTEEEDESNDGAPVDETSNILEELLDMFETENGRSPTEEEMTQWITTFRSLSVSPKAEVEELPAAASDE